MSELTIWLIRSPCRGRLVAAPRERLFSLYLDLVCDPCQGFLVQLDLSELHCSGPFDFAQGRLRMRPSLREECWATRRIHSRGWSLGFRGGGLLASRHMSGGETHSIQKEWSVKKIAADWLRKGNVYYPPIVWAGFVLRGARGA